ncbi:MAG: nuclear transport factor 2 family protein [Nocardioides sp.]
MHALLNTFYGSFESGDGSAFGDSLAPDILFLGTDEAEWWQGADEVRRVWGRQLDELHSAGVGVRGGEPSVVTNGDVVWAVDRPTVHLADGTTVRLRLTLVAVRDGDRLMLRHLHASVGAPNEEVVKQELTL